jgi:hypothetical protein
VRLTAAFMLVTMGALVAAATAGAQESAAQLRARFQQESNAIRKAKMMVKLGDLQSMEVQKDLAGDHFPEALATIEQYSDETAESSRALDALNVNAEKHPRGFRELQISIREFLRRLTETTASLTGEEQEPMLKVRKNIEETNQHLIHELFPARPAPGTQGQ